MKQVIYAKTLNPEDFDYRAYDIRDDEGNEVIIDGGRHFNNIDSKGYIEVIKRLIDDYCYFGEYYYNNSIMAYLRDYLPKKENGKRLSTREANKILIALDLDNEEEIIATCLSVITSKPYAHTGLRGSCQGDYVETYYPVRKGIQEYLDWIEAWFFGTGIEIEVSDEGATCAEEVSGWTFYTASWKVEDLKREIKSNCGYKADDEDIEVKLWLYSDSYRIRHDNYKLAD